MATTFTIARREFRAYWDSPIAYVFLAAFSITVSFLFFREFFATGVASLRQLFVLLPLLFVFLVPLITMRLWSEERRTGTEELLLTFPARIRDAVVGKFLAAWALLAAALLLTLPLALTVAWLATAPGLDTGPVLGAYLAALLMGGAYLSIGLFFSSLTHHQIVAAVLTMAVLFALWFAGKLDVLIALPEWLRPWTDGIALDAHFRAVARGVLDVRDVGYYAAVTALFLALNGLVIHARRWR